MKKTRKTAEKQQQRFHPKTDRNQVELKRKNTHRKQSSRVKKHFYYFADWFLAGRETLSLAACVLQRSKSLRGSRTQQGEILFQFNINSIAI